MDTRTGEVKSMEAWTDALGEKEAAARVASGRLVEGNMKDLEQRALRMALSRGTKNQRKKYRQMKKQMEQGKRK